MGTAVTLQIYNFNSYLPLMSLGSARGVRFTCDWDPEQETEAPRTVGLATGSKGLDTLPFSFYILDLDTSPPRLPPRSKQPVIIVYVHCM